jgi:hypothetical protein
MIVDTVSPTPFALLRRAKHFQYRDSDRALQEFSNYEDPIQALTDECRRVLKNISSANDSSTTKASTSLRDASWSRFEDMGFSGFGEESEHDDEADESVLGRKRREPQGLRTTARSRTDLGRPTTPSWADFLSSGFVDDPSKTTSGLLLPPDKILPPINIRGHSSQSHRHMTDNDSSLEPGELANIITFKLDDAFWWVWISSLAGEEPLERKAVFGRCALIETNIRGGKWLVMEEIIKGAAPEPEAGAYIAEKKGRFGFSKRTRLTRSKSTGGRKALQQQKTDSVNRSHQQPAMSKTSIAPDQHARIQAAAAALQQKHLMPEPASPRRGRNEEAASQKTNSVFTLQPVLMSEAVPAMKWASSYDKDAIRAKYLGDNFAGKGSSSDLRLRDAASNGQAATNGSTTMVTTKAPAPSLPKSDSYFNTESHPALRQTEKDRSLPALPQGKPDDLSSEPPVHDPQPVVRESAPLPAAPAVNVQAANEATAAAAKVPIPATTPLESPRTSRKPLPPAKQSEDSVKAPRPESFSSGPEYSEQPITTNGIATPDTSPESQKTGGKRLKKKTTQGGFKGMFGRKKTEMPPPAAIEAPRNSTTANAPKSTPVANTPLSTTTANAPKPTPPANAPKSTPANAPKITPVADVPKSTTTSAVAAARAALEARNQAVQQAQAPLAPSQDKTSRRFSGVPTKKKPAEANNTAPTRQAPSMPYMAEEQRVPKPELTPQPSPRFPIDQFRSSQASLGRVSTNEQRHAEREFRSFDQGPLIDQPAFVPEDSPVRTSGFGADEERSPQAPVHPPTKAHEIAARVFSAPVLAAPRKKEVPDDVSEVSDDATQQITPVQDRWAQIRKNAAERAAMTQRQSEEQSGRTDNRTDDGDTTEEESKSRPLPLLYINY